MAKNRRDKNKKTQKTYYCIYGYPITKETIPGILIVISVIVAIVVLASVFSDTEISIWGEMALGFLLLFVFVWYASTAEEKESNYRETAELKNRIRVLEDLSKSNDTILNLLEKENQQLREKYYEQQGSEHYGSQKEKTDETS